MFAQLAFNLRLKYVMPPNTVQQGPDSAQERSKMHKMASGQLKKLPKRPLRAPRSPSRGPHEAKSIEMSEEV